MGRCVDTSATVFGRRDAPSLLLAGQSLQRPVSKVHLRPRPSRQSVPAVGGVVLAAARRIVGIWWFTYLKSLRKIHRRRASALTPPDAGRGGLEHARTGSARKGANSQVALLLP